MDAGNRLLQQERKREKMKGGATLKKKKSVKDKELDRISVLCFSLGWMVITS